MTEALAADRYRSNAHLIAAAARLYLSPSDRVLDVTYGLGRFWGEFRPDDLTGTDLNPEKSLDGRSTDFTDLPFADEEFDATVLDPPYRLNGTPDRGEFDANYGTDEPQRWQDRMHQIDQGISECVRVTRRSGHLLLKCQDQVVSGHKVFQGRHFTRTAEDAGCTLLDELHYLTSPRPQPPGRRQVHSRSNFSTLLIFRRNRR